MEHRIENYILDELKKYGTLCFPLIDSENSTNAALIGNKAQSLGASAILIGGSSATDQIELAEMVSTLKSNLPSSESLKEMSFFGDCAYMKSQPKKLITKNKKYFKA